jgi:hypothetical protein
MEDGGMIAVSSQTALWCVLSDADLESLSDALAVLAVLEREQEADQQFNRERIADWAEAFRDLASQEQRRRMSAPGLEPPALLPEMTRTLDDPTLGQLHLIVEQLAIRAQSSSLRKLLDQIAIVLSRVRDASASYAVSTAIEPSLE